MIRIAISDPDEHVWAYSILVSGKILDGDAILTLSRAMPRWL